MRRDGGRCPSALRTRCAQSAPAAFTLPMMSPSHTPPTASSPPRSIVFANIGKPMYNYLLGYMIQVVFASIEVMLIFPAVITMITIINKCKLYILEGGALKSYYF